MTFAARLTRSPLPHDPDRAREARDRFAALTPELRDLVAGTAGCSSYLGGLLARESDWAEAALAGAPETALSAELGALDGLASDQLSSALRRAKRRVALLTGLADLGGVWSLMQVTGALSALADRAVDVTLRALAGDEIRRGRLPAPPESAARAGGMVSIAMGKGGAEELNYSSDIDLICLFDDSQFGPDDYQEARAAFIKITRRMTQLLSDVTAEGYVFRTDLRLRPDAAVTPVCMAMGAAEEYYEAQGRTWERAAFIKARASAGDIAAGERFLKALTPFVWRRHLDFAAIQDAHDMRLRIRDHKGLHGPIVLEGHNMKLGAGGIREIEFFTQTRQLIAGGRDPELRDRTTLGGLAKLAGKGWVPGDVAEELAALYTAHREIEHRVQMVNDAQTHLLPTTPEGFDRIARMCGEGDTARFRAGLRARLDRVAELTEGFFAPGHVREKGPELSDSAAQVVEGWRSYPALRSGRAVEIFKRVQPVLLERMERAANFDEALRNFDGFLAKLPAGVQLFSLFDANPQLVDLIVDICATAPGLSAYLSRHAQVLDAVIAGRFFAPWPGLAALKEDLASQFAQVADYEGKLSRARVWAKEWHFRTGVHHLRGLIDAAEAASQYAQVAEAAVACLWGPICDDLARKHGAAPGRGAVVVAMGSLGAERLNAASDLDLLVIYDGAGVEQSDGPRPLATRPYFARLTQGLVTALTAQLPEGRLYEVDMRLRPSGRQGPVATALPGFLDYQLTEAWTWEHLALTRARVIAGPPDLAADFESARREVLAAKAQGPQVLPDLAEMRARIFAAKAPDGEWEAKVGPGRLQDIELLAQSCALRAADPARKVEAQLRAGVRAGLLSREDEATLARATRFLWRLQAGGRLLTDKPLDMAAIGEGGRAFLLRETGCADLPSLAARLASETGAAAAVIAGKLGAEVTHGAQADGSD